MPHQARFVDVFLEVQSEEAGDPEPGEWAYDDATLTGPRRFGKTAILSPLVAHRARLLERAQMFLTAQNRDKAVRRWHDVLSDLKRSPLRGDFRSKVGNMHEEIRWIDSDGVLIPFAPNEDGLHSETPDLVLIDELWAFDAEQARAIKAGYVPAFATSSGQALKMSTQGTDRSVWLNEVTRAGRRAVEAGVRSGVLYHEYSLPDRVEVDGVRVRLRQLSDEQLVEACIAYHPAVCHVTDCRGPSRGRPCSHGFTVRPAALRSAWLEMGDRQEYLRAYGNRAAADVAARWQALDEAVWLSAVETDPIPPSARVAFGVWVDEDGDDAAVSAGWRSPSGTMLVEHMHTQTGIRGLVDYVTTRTERNDPATVAVANVGPARDVADELEAAGVPVLRVGQADVSAACSRHRSELAAGSWRHAVSTAATAAAEAADWSRNKWDRPGDSISALGSQTLAGWGIDHAPPLKVRRPFKVR